jgi:hypothetical protein
MYKWIVAAAKTSLGSPHFRRAVGGAFLLLATRQSTFAMRWMTPNRCRDRLFLPVPRTLELRAKLFIMLLQLGPLPCQEPQMERTVPQH